MTLIMGGRTNSFWGSLWLSTVEMLITYAQNTTNTQMENTLELLICWTGACRRQRKRVVGIVVYGILGFKLN